ncbi:hypothetical protein [Kiloniella antarctica]|uniref:Uncharacterized protein n=1 Tax=Kiloniella antarctica TaxID=1550907 RepID=A0ABW5BKZ9_9PROT
MSILTSSDSVAQFASRAKANPTRLDGDFSLRAAKSSLNRTRKNHFFEGRDTSIKTVGGRGYRSPAEVLYPVEKPVLSPYISLAPSPVRRVRGLATLDLRRAEYNSVL